MAISCDASRQYPKAIKLYQQYLEASLNSADFLGEVLAYNHLGIDYFYLGKPENIQTSIEYHKKHRETARDTGKSLFVCVIFS